MKNVMNVLMPRRDYGTQIFMIVMMKYDKEYMMNTTLVAGLAPIKKKIMLLMKTPTAAGGQTPAMAERYSAHNT